MTNEEHNRQRDRVRASLLADPKSRRAGIYPALPIIKAIVAAYDFRNDQSSIPED